MSSYADAVKFCQDVASTLHGLSTVDKVKRIYQIVDKEPVYGVSKGFEKGIWVRYPHEVTRDNQANCHERALYAYMLAKATGFETKFFEVMLENASHGAVELREGEKIYFLNPSHGVIDVSAYDDITVEGTVIAGHEEMPDFKALHHLPEQEILERTEKLRSDGIAMVHDWQEFSPKVDGIRQHRDFVHYDDGTRVLERKTVLGTPYALTSGFLVHERWKLKADGVIDDLIIHFSQADSIRWGEEDGKVPLARINRQGKIVINKLTESERDAVAKAIAYREKAKNGRIHTDEDILACEQKIKEKIEFYAAQPGAEHVRNYFERIMQVQDQKDRYNILDWFMFVEEYKENVPTQRQIQEPLVNYIADLYIEAKREAESGDAAFEKLKDHISQSRANIIPSEKISPSADAVASVGIASVYRQAAEDWQALASKASTEEESLALMEKYFTLALVDSRFVDALRPLVRYVEAKSTHKKTPIKTEKKKKKLVHYEGDEWFDEDRTTYVSLEVERDSQAYDSFLRVELGFSETGKFTGATVSIYDGIKDSENSYLIFEQHYPTLEDLWKAEVKDLEKQAIERLPAILAKKVLDAPEPHTERDFLEKNLLAILHWSSKKRQSYFTKEELDKVYELLDLHNHIAAEFPLETLDAREHARKCIASWNKKKAEQPENFYATMQENAVHSIITTKDEEEAKHVIERKFGPYARTSNIPTEMQETLMREHIQKHAILFELAVTPKETKWKDAIEQYGEGLKRKIPSSEDVSTYLSELDQISSVIHQANKNVEQGNLDVSELRQEVIGFSLDVRQQKILDQCLLSFQYRLEETNPEQSKQLQDLRRKMKNGELYLTFDDLGISFDVPQDFVAPTL